jgi:hypothetical protein
MDYLERYNAGEYEQVWRELVAFGDRVREEPLYSQAVAVARQTMLRAKTNIETLLQRLESINYQFEYPDSLYNPPTPERLARLARIESQGGILPLSVKTFYEIVGEVCFMGVHPQLSSSFELGNYSIDVYSDPFCVAYPYSDALDYYEATVSTDASNIDEAGHIIRPYALFIAPDSAQKAGDSGGGPYEIYFPDSAVDAPIHDWIKKATFVEFLRENFRWGGFPGFMYSANPPKETLDFLTRDLLPI